jgi:Arc/MetJ-type ribon-helix-helix transcriptional regulator
MRITLSYMKILTVKLPESVFAEIEGAAKARRVSKSEIVRERLSRTREIRTSLWSRMEDLVIQRDSLPKDLSFNKTHLKGYGKNRSNR